MAVTAQRINRYLRSHGSPLAGYGAAILRASRRYGVNPGIIIAIAGHETGYGNLRAGGPGPAVHNAWGIRARHNSGRFVPKAYPNWQAGIMDVARLLGSYKKQGMVTPEQIVGYYAYGVKGKAVPAYSQYLHQVMNQLGTGGFTGGTPTTRPGRSQRLPGTRIPGVPNMKLPAIHTGLSQGQIGTLSGLYENVGLDPSMLSLLEGPTIPAMTIKGKKGKVIPGQRLPGQPRHMRDVGGVQVAFSGKLTAKDIKVVNLARKFVGRPYVWGGASPATSFDCSGLIQYIWGQAGVQLPHASGLQYDMGKKVGLKNLRPGDAVFFYPGEAGAAPGKPGHVGVYIGHGKIIEARGHAYGIVISNLRQRIKGGGYMGARRYG